MSETLFERDERSFLYCILDSFPEQRRLFVHSQRADEICRNTFDSSRTVRHDNWIYDFVTLVLRLPIIRVNGKFSEYSISLLNRSHKCHFTDNIFLSQSILPEFWASDAINQNNCVEVTKSLSPAELVGFFLWLLQKGPEHLSGIKGLCVLKIPIGYYTPDPQAIREIAVGNGEVRRCDSTERTVYLGERATGQRRRDRHCYQSLQRSESHCEYSRHRYISQNGLSQTISRKQVMALKQQMKMLHKTGSLVCVATEPLIESRRNPLPMSLASGKSHLTNIARNLGRRRGSNVYGATREPPASMQLAALLRQIQTFHKQLQLVS